MAHMVELLASLALVLVGGRATSAMAPIRARNSDGWPTFHADGSLDAELAVTAVMLLRGHASRRGKICISYAYLLISISVTRHMPL